MAMVSWVKKWWLTLALRYTLGAISLPRRCQSKLAAAGEKLQLQLPKIRAAQKKHVCEGQTV